jgi:antitoxin component YwqK of YwqJK toxin-antitoxin module
VKIFKTQKYINDSLVYQNYIDGDHIEFYSSNGILLSKGLTSNNKKQGIWKYYRKDDGTLEIIQNWKNDLQHGLRLEYLPNGKISNKSNWKNGRENGLVIHYYENVNIKDSMNTFNGYVHGLTYIYYENKNIKSIENFFKGEKIDTCIYYFQNGSVKGIEIHNLDTMKMLCIGNVLIYYDNGVLHKSFFTLKDIPHGKAKIFYPTGETKKIINLPNDLE